MPKRGVLLFLTLLLLFVLVGCFQGEQNVKEIDVPEDVEVIEDDSSDVDEEEEAVDEEAIDEEDGEDLESAETVDREIYVFDQDGMVVPQTFELPKSDAAAMQVLEYMVKDGPVTELLPNGFQAVLPSETDILGVNLKEDGTAIVDVSEEFKEYQAEDELRILQAITHTLTEFEDIDKIKLWMNGYELNEMPVNGTPITEGYSKANGINIMTNEQPDLLHSTALTTFLPKQYEETFYYVPVTQYYHGDENNIFAEMIEDLVMPTGTNSQFMQVFNDGTKLLNEPSINDGVLQLEFSEDILHEKENGVIADDVMETLVRTLTEQEEVEAIEVTVEEQDTLINETGHTYEEPVTKEHFLQSEKM